MVRFRSLLGACILALMAGPVYAQQALIDQGLLPLPDELKGGATVVHYSARGESEVIRQGAGEMVCRVYTYLGVFYSQCYHEDLHAMFDRFYALLAEGVSTDEAAVVLDQEILDGELSVNNGGTEYLLTGPTEQEAALTITVTVPGATGANTGLPTEEREEEPWLMWAGTQVAHVMIPRGIPDS